MAAARSSTPGARPKRRVMYQPPPAATPPSRSRPCPCQAIGRRCGATAKAAASAWRRGVSGVVRPLAGMMRTVHVIPSAPQELLGAHQRRDGRRCILPVTRPVVMRSYFWVNGRVDDVISVSVPRWFDGGSNRALVSHPAPGRAAVWAARRISNGKASSLGPPQTAQRQMRR